MIPEPAVARPASLPDERPQWRIETLQLLNWGGFHGRHEVHFAEGSTLISGASGSGKSTILDAYIALMMPSDTPFNGASNSAGGRSRSSEQRNLLTYLRGKMDDSRVDDSDTLRDQVLRGRNGEPVWGALSGTFRNSAGRRYTIVRIFFLKPAAMINSDVTTTFAAFDGHLDLSRLEPFAATRFDKRTLKAGISGLTTFGSFREFEHHMHTRLSIGDAGSGRKAMRLLSRVQAGMEIDRVDGLYKSMVLEKPITYAAADHALSHFANLDAAYEKMLDEASKVKTLHRLPELQRDLADAETKAQMIQQFGADIDGPTPFQLWRLRTHRRLLDAAVDRNRHDYRATTKEWTTASAIEGAHNAALAQIARDKNAHGGGAIEERRAEIHRLRAARDTAYNANLRFQTRIEHLRQAMPETAEEFVALHAEAEEFMEDVEARKTALSADEDRIRDDELSPLTTRQVELVAERRSLQGRTGMVPRRLHEARVRMAEAAGLDPMEDLPFVAELIDVLPEENHWRAAIETTLGGLARTLLIDRSVRDRFSAAIDGIVVSPRLRYQAVTLAVHHTHVGDGDYVSGKLAFKDSPFSAWVQSRVHDDDHLCVPSAAGLGGSGPRVTPSGQTRNGDRGAHGTSGDGPIIGFSNERRLADIETQLHELDTLIKAVRDRITHVRARIDDLDRQKAAHQIVLSTEWLELDHLGVERRIQDLENEILRLRAANEVLDQLEAEEERLRPLLAEANRDRILAEDRRDGLEKDFGDLVSAQDRTQDGINAIEQAQTAQVTEEQQGYLDALFTANWGGADLAAFTNSMTALRQRLRTEADAARKSAASSTSAMQDMFENYQRSWPEHNLGVDAASADGYREILDRIRSAGLHERRNTWRREFTAWSSDDLLRLNDAFDTARDEITDRLEPINRILSTLPFGGKGVLQINLRPLPSEELRTFRRALRTLSSGLAVEMSDEQVDRRFRQLRDFMAKIGAADAQGKAAGAQRDRYLDVRQHVLITAACLDESGREIATYDSLGGKSGGENQELVAFIVGSALRYQLGDETRARPTFAAVLLDEGFVKADSEFSGRAIQAWQNLGFQLIIGAPLDKVTGLEPHMNLLLTATKDTDGYSFMAELRDAPQPEEAA